MDRRAFLTKTLLAVGVIAAVSSGAQALPVTPRDAVAPEGPVENVWWRRWHWRRWHWRRW